MWVMIFGTLYDLCLPFVSTGVCGRKERGGYMEESGHVSRSLERYEDFVMSLYILLSLPVISWLVSEVRA